MHASFWALYKRGRLEVRGVPENERMEQRERFGVACLAQCFQHERAFRDAFLALCHLESSETKWRVSVDPYSEPSARWADILLETNTCAVVVECKVHDRLEPKQNPWENERTFLAPREGYGWYFAREVPRKRRIYVTLTESSVYKPKLLSGTECLSLTWAQVRELRTRGDWITDLFVSLGSLDYTSF